MQMYPMPGQNMYGYQNMNQYRYDIPQISGNTNPYADYGLQGYQQPLSNLNQINQNYYFPKKVIKGRNKLKCIIKLQLLFKFLNLIQTLK